MKRRVRYYVYYGTGISKQDCYSLADVNSFIAHCLRMDIRIGGVTKA